MIPILLFNKKIADIRIKRYRRLEHLLSCLWDMDLTLSRIRKMKFNMVCTDMKLCKLSGADFVKATLRDGIYGFAYPREKEIHFWCKENVSRKKILGFFGHEVGHIREKEIIKRARYVKNAIGVEKFAEAIRHTTEVIYKIVDKLFPGAKNERNRVGDHQKVPK